MTYRLSIFWDIFCPFSITEVYLNQAEIFIVSVPKIHILSHIVLSAQLIGLLVAQSLIAKVLANSQGFILKTS